MDVSKYAKTVCKKSCKNQHQHKIYFDVNSDLIKRLFSILILFPDIKSIPSHLVWLSDLKFSKPYFDKGFKLYIYWSSRYLFTHIIFLSTLSNHLLKVVRDRTCKFLTNLHYLEIIVFMIQNMWLCTFVVQL